MTGFDREARATVPLGRGTGVVCRRAFAAEFEQAPAGFRAFIIERVGEFALLVERAAIAAIVDCRAEERHWPSMLVEIRNRTKRQEMREHGRHDRRNRRAARNVDDRFVGHEVHYRNGAGRIRVGTRNTTECGATADCDNCRSACDGLFQHVDIADSSNGREPGIAHWDRAIDEDQVAAVVFFHRRVSCGFSLISGRRLKRVMVVERDCIENESFDGWRRRSRQRFGAPGALLE